VFKKDVEYYIKILGVIVLIQKEKRQATDDL
jgi:hypothetical protein